VTSVQLYEYPEREILHRPHGVLDDSCSGEFSSSKMTVKLKHNKSVRTFHKYPGIFDVFGKLITILRKFRNIHSFLGA